MIIKKIAIGDSSEAFIEDRLNNSLNIIYSDDNNKGKTIVMQSALYAIGNEAIFPSSFNFQDYYHYVEIELDDGKLVISCRKGSSFIVKIGDSLSILDSVSELKRYLNRNGFNFPEIIKDSSLKMADPVLLYQVFFVGQDKKNSSTIFNDNYYKKDDFWNLVYVLAGIDVAPDIQLDRDEIQKKIASLNDEKKLLKSQNKILKKSSPVGDAVTQTRSNEAFESTIKKINTVRDKITEITKQRNHAFSRKVINEKTLKEIRSLNRTSATGSLYCIDCGSEHIGYSSGDKSYTFDITDASMRSNIIASIQDKISAYQEEIESCTQRINELQRQLQELLSEEEVDLEAVLLYKNEIVQATDADTRIAEIEKELKSLKGSLRIDKTKSEEDVQKKFRTKDNIVSQMNEFYRRVDPNGSIVFNDMFSQRNGVYSGSELTEFYIAKLYALAVVLQHKFPIMMDDFRDGELSTDKENVVLEIFGSFINQIIFTATLKDEELGKYKKANGINAIDYSGNTDSHILNARSVDEFRELLKSLMIML